MSISQPKLLNSFNMNSGQQLQFQGHSNAFLSVKFAFANFGTLGLFCNGELMDTLHPDQSANCMEIQSLKIVCPTEGGNFCSGDIYMNEIQEC